MNKIHIVSAPDPRFTIIKIDGEPALNISHAEVILDPSNPPKVILTITPEEIIIEGEAQVTRK